MTYTYDGFGNLKTTTDSGGHVTTIGYDLLGRKTSLIDKDLGNRTYTVDALGRTRSMLDAKGQTTTLTYDALDRLTCLTAKRKFLTVAVRIACQESKQAIRR